MPDSVSPARTMCITVRAWCAGGGSTMGATCLAMGPRDAQQLAGIDARRVPQVVPDDERADGGAVPRGDSGQRLAIGDAVQHQRRAVRSAWRATLAPLAREGAARRRSGSGRRCGSAPPAARPSCRALRRSGSGSAPPARPRPGRWRPPAACPACPPRWRSPGRRPGSAASPEWIGGALERCNGRIGIDDSGAWCAARRRRAIRPRRQADARRRA